MNNYKLNVNEGGDYIFQNVSKIFSIILEDFYNFLCLRKFERRAKIEVTNWQPFQFLRFAVNCYQRHSS